LRSENLRREIAKLSRVFMTSRITPIRVMRDKLMFSYSQNDLYCEQVPLADLAQRAGTPAYVYSSASVLSNYRAYDEAFGCLPHAVCYAVKANSSLAVLAQLAKSGAGFDIVSGGALFRVLQAGGDASNVVFLGVG